jgi:hypothetical protein
MWQVRRATRPVIAILADRLRRTYKAKASRSNFPTGYGAKTGMGNPNLLNIEAAPHISCWFAAKQVLKFDTLTMLNSNFSQLLQVFIVT